MSSFRPRMTGWNDHSVHLHEVRRQEVEALRAELDEKEALIRDLRSELVDARKQLVGFQLTSTREQQSEAAAFGTLFYEAGRCLGDHPHGLRDDAA